MHVKVKGSGEIILVEEHKASPLSPQKTTKSVKFPKYLIGILQIQ